MGSKLERDNSQKVRDAKHIRGLIEIKAFFAFEYTMM
jgi:hypothetical protein